MEPPQKVQRSRSANFTANDCLLLAELMGEQSGSGELNRHQYCRHKFTSSITAESKRAMWRVIHSAFNSRSGQARELHELSKKWDNLVQKEKNKYSDFIQSQRKTGGGPLLAPLGPITEAVMSAVGRNSTTVCGLPGTDLLDSGLLQLSGNCSTLESSCATGEGYEMQSVPQPASNSSSLVNLHESIEEQSQAVNLSLEYQQVLACGCPCHSALEKLQTAKFLLEIKKLKRDLGEE